MSHRAWIPAVAPQATFWWNTFGQPLMFWPRCNGWGHSCAGVGRLRDFPGTTLAMHVIAPWGVLWTAKPVRLFLCKPLGFRQCLLWWLMFLLIIY